MRDSPLRNNESQIDVRPKLFNRKDKAVRRNNKNKPQLREFDY